MLHTAAQSDDPLRATLALTALFAVLCGIRLTLPSITYFDEVHYVPAAKALLEGTGYVNREHPLLGKQLMALGIMIFGDNAFGWRVMPYLAGILAFFAMMRAFWLASLSRFASSMFGFLIITGFMLMVHSRLAMLDIFMVASLAVAAWQFAGSLREPETAHRRLLFTGIALGAAMASKWNAIPLAMVPGLVFFAACVAERGRLNTGFFARIEDVLMAKRALPIRGVSLVQAAFYVGAVPLLVYAATFVPSLLYSDSPLGDGGLIALHTEMLDLQSQVLQPHPYQSNWGEWLFNLRGIWYLHEYVDEAQRGVLLIGNPGSMLLGLPALVWCGYDGFTRRDPAKIAVVIGFAVSLGLWLIAPKSVQFYYHYLVPSIFLMAALALALEALWKVGERGMVMIALALPGIMFAYFYPILTAARLTDDQAFRYYTWIDGWI